MRQSVGGPRTRRGSEGQSKMVTVIGIFVVGAVVFLFGNIAGKPWAPPWSWGICLVVIELLRVLPLGGAR